VTGELPDLPEGTPLVDARGGWRRLLRGFLELATGEGAARALGFVAVIVLSRHLGPGGFGLITLGVSLVGWFALVVDSGTETLNIREISRHPHRFREIADRVLGLRIAISIVVAGVFVLGAYALSRSPHDRAVLVRFALVLPAVALNLRWMVLGIGQARSVAVGNVASRLLFLVGVAILVGTQADVTRVPYLEAGGELAYALVIIGLVSRGVGVPRPKIDLPYWKETLRQGLPLLLYGVSRATILTFDLLVVTAFLGPSKVGYYGAALKPVITILGVLGLFSVSFLASYSGTEPTHAAALFRKTAQVSLAICLPITLVLSAGAPIVVPLIFGGTYDPAIGLLAVMAWSIPLSALAVPYTAVLIARERQVTLMRNSFWSAGFCVAGLLILVPLVGIYGAAAMRVATAALVLGLNYRSTVARGLAPRASAAFGRAS
jgi:O-antigen/teichoic acid export membrane protein